MIERRPALLEEKLKLNELRQLDQRIGIRCYLKPLPRKETYRYVEHRLRIAGLPAEIEGRFAGLRRWDGEERVEHEIS